MNWLVNPLPGKISFYRILFRLLASLGQHHTVLDCACAVGKHRHLFPGQEYHGADVEAQSIEKARQVFSTDPLAHFHNCDMLEVAEHLQGLRFDLGVCTHTVAHIAPDMKSRALLSMTQLIRDGGNLIVQCTSEDASSVEPLFPLFRSFEATPYGGAVGRVCKDLTFRAYPGVAGAQGKKPGRLAFRLLCLLAWCASLFDFIGPHEAVLFVLRSKLPASSGEHEDCHARC